VGSVVGSEARKPLPLFDVSLVNSIVTKVLVDDLGDQILARKEGVHGGLVDVE
jgi:hypothetical protein